MFTYTVYARFVTQQNGYVDVVTDYGDVVRVVGMQVSPGQCLDVTVQCTRVVNVKKVT